MVYPFKGVMFDTMSGMSSQGPDAQGRRKTCSDFEINHVECLEAYGLLKGREMCTKYEEDYYECRTDMLKHWRVQMMTLERYKKVAKGELPRSALKSDAPSYEAYMNACYHP